MPEVSENIVHCNQCNGEINTNTDNYHNFGGDEYCDDCFCAYYCYCADCGEVICDDESYYREANGYSYCSYCWESNGYSNDDRGHREDFSPKRVRLDNVTYKHLRNQRCFGIELEINDRDLPYSDIESRTIFGSKYDGSLNCGSEFISPILQGDIGYNAIKTFCDIVGNANVGTCAGYHLHIDCRNLTWKGVKKVWLLYNIFEGVLYDMLPNSRKHNNYCRVSTMDTKRIAEIQSREELKRLWYSQGDNDIHNHYNDTRYFGCNLHAYFYQSTIEIRYHSGTSNFEKIINWIKINQALFEYALTHSVADIYKLKDFENCYTNYTRVRKLFKKVIKNQSLWRYYKTRYNKFTNKKFGFYWNENDQRILDDAEQNVSSRTQVDFDRNVVLSGTIDAVRVSNSNISNNELSAEVINDARADATNVMDNERERRLRGSQASDRRGDSRCENCVELDAYGLCFSVSCNNHPQSAVA